MDSTCGRSVWKTRVKASRYERGSFATRMRILRTFVSWPFLVLRGPDGHGSEQPIPALTLRHVHGVVSGIEESTWFSRVSERPDCPSAEPDGETEVAL